jgi:hypothetical protein
VEGISEIAARRRRRGGGMIDPRVPLRLGEEIDELRRELSAFREKLDREKLAKVLWDRAMEGHPEWNYWYYEITKPGLLKDADAIIKYFNE